MYSNKFIGIGLDFDYENEIGLDICDFSDTVSILNYSGVLIAVDYLIHEYIKNPTEFEGLRCLNNDSGSAKLKSDMERRRQEIEELLENGNNIYVILPTEQYIFVRTGRKEYSGTGKNRQTTNIVEKYNLLSFLPVGMECIKASGNKISFSGVKPYEIIWNNMGSHLYYHSFIKTCEGIPLMKIYNTNKVVSQVVSYKKGNIIFLPAFAEEECYENEIKRNEAINICISALKELDINLKSDIADNQLPEWCDNIYLPDEIEQITELKKLNIQLQEIKEKISNQEHIVQEISRIKFAFTSTGSVLEEVCKEIFHKLGFTIMPTEANRSDLVLQYGKKQIVVEIKGLTKSAGEKNAAQLEKWVCEHIEHYNIRPKAILLVNGYKDLPLEKRTEQIFPQQMIKYATNREQCLISTVQLVCLYIDCIKNNKSKSKNIKKLLETVGVYNGYTNISEYLHDNSLQVQ